MKFSTSFLRLVASLLLILATHGLFGQAGNTVTVLDDTSPNADCFNPSVTFQYQETDGSGRNVYFSNAFAPNLLYIFYDQPNNRWVINDGSDLAQARQSLATNGPIFEASSTFFPNPPSTNSGVTWTRPNNFTCTGTITSVTGDGTQDNQPVADPCVNNGGDSDGDGVCDDSDICAGFDDNVDPDMDGLPTGCDPNPNDYDGIETTNGCFSRNGPNAFFKNTGNTDATGRSIYRRDNFNNDFAIIRYNSTMNRWEIVVQTPTFGEQIEHINTFASFPDPPASSVSAWTLGPDVATCTSNVTVGGIEAQTTLGCDVMVSTASAGQSSCNTNGSITVASMSPTQTDEFFISGPVSQSNSTGNFTSLPAGTYTAGIRDTRFPPGDCQDTRTLTIQDPTPGNDEPGGATSAAVNSGTSPTQTSSLNTCGATVSSVTMASCANAGAGGDVWANFVAQDVNQLIDILNLVAAGPPVASPNLIVSVYNGTTELACGSFSGTNSPQLLVGGLSVGQSYLVRMQAAGSDPLDFDLAILTDASLPLDLLSFTAETGVKVNSFTWVTANEIGVATHDLERSLGGNDWQPIVTVKAVGTSPAATTYRAEDTAPPADALYRVRSVDFSGSMQFSPIRRLRRNERGDLLVFPNPVSTMLTLRFSATERARKVVLTDVDGRRLGTHVVAPETNTITIPTGALGSGLYTINLAGTSVRFIKQ